MRTRKRVGAEWRWSRVKQEGRGSKRGNVEWTDGKDSHAVGGRGNNCIGKRKKREGERWELRWRACVSHNISSASY